MSNKMEAIEKIERGDSKSFAKSMIIFSAVIIGFIVLYYILDPLFCTIWGARSGWYLDEYRTRGAKVWRTLYRATSHWYLTIWLPILWAFSAYCIQRGLKQDKAKIFNKAHIIVIFIYSIMSFFAFTYLMCGPLIR